MADDRRHIALIGFRGAGKTSVGRLLAAELGRPFIDTDESVAQSTGLTIARIFASEGETEFRRHEAQAVAQAVSSPPAVIAVGGGAVENSANVALLRGYARVVWLEADVSVLRRRILADPQTNRDRPALEGRSALDEIESMLARRVPLYRAAAETIIDVSAMHPEEIADELQRLLTVQETQGTEPPNVI
ncbi:MAG TPA: shikimate kinase [Phycisphaerae bacterium]|jgi:shikimate kinase